MKGSPIANRPTDGQARIWQALKTGRSLTTIEMVDASGMSRPSVQWVVRSWVIQGFALTEGAGNQQRYRLTPEGVALAETPMPYKVGSAHPAGRAAQHLWTAARMLPDWTVDELAAHAIAGPVDAIPEAEVRNFVNILARAGYIKVLRKARPGGSAARYRLIRNTGPQPPTERRIRVVWDPNLGELTHVPEVSA